MADKVQGILNGIQTQLQIQSTISQKVDGVVFRIEDLDPESPTYGCMILGTPGLQISKTRTEDGKDWDWSTAMTAGGIVADAIVSGILRGVTIISPSNNSYRGDITIEGGEISSYFEKSNSYFDLTTDRLNFIDRPGTADEYSVSYKAQGFQGMGYAGYYNLVPTDSGMMFELGKYENDLESSVTLTPGHLKIVRDGKTIVEY